MFVSVSIASSVLRPQAAGEEQRLLPISARRLDWQAALKEKKMLREKIRRHNGRIAFFVHTGGSYIIDRKAKELYLHNIKQSLTEETGVVFILGGDYRGLKGIKTRAIIVDIASVSPYHPVPSVGVRVSLNSRESRKAAWNKLIEIMREMEVKSISPFGGEEVTFDTEGLVRIGYEEGIGCVGASLSFLRGEFIIEVFPQLCGGKVYNEHLKGGHSIADGAYWITELYGEIAYHPHWRSILESI